MSNDRIAHRQRIGGAWEEIGKLQFEYMLRQGLRPDHRLLDYGCGSGRGAVHFVPYLNRGNYLGVDTSLDMIAAAVDEVHEVGGGGHFLHMSELTSRSKIFDFAICQSVFTHCSADQIAVIMADMDSLLTEDGVLYATFFRAPFKRRFEPITHEPGGRITYHDRDPYHQTLDFWLEQPWSKDWKVDFLGAWDHPRSQKMLEIRRRK